MKGSNKMKKSLKMVFKEFDENCGWKSIERFMEFVEMFESKDNFKKLNMLVDEFKNSDCIKKDFVNFRRFCLGK